MNFERTFNKTGDIESTPKTLEELAGMVISSIDEEGRTDPQTELDCHQDARKAGFLEKDLADLIDKKLAEKRNKKE